MSQPAEDPARAAALQNVQNAFLPFDPEKKGAVPAAHLGAVFAATGYPGLSEKLLANAEAILDTAGDNLIHFGAYVWLWDILNHATHLFGQKQANNVVADSELAGILGALGFNNIDKRTVHGLTVLVDPANSGHFGLHDLFGALFFIHFSLSLFHAVDTEKKGSLLFAQFETVLPNLNITGVTSEQAQNIFNVHDLDKSGTMEPMEFIDLALVLKFPHLAHN